MTDIIDRLRGSAPSILAMRDAANEINTLRETLDRLQAAAARLTDNVAEFGTVTDDVFIDDVIRAEIAARAILNK